MVAYSKPGYLTKVLPVQLDNGVLTIINVQLVDSMTAGLAEQGSEPQIQITSNPAQEYLSIVFPAAFLNSNDLMSLRIYDATGREVAEKKIHSTRITIDKKDFSSGMYFYQLQKGSAIKGRGKFIFQ
jgi:hypothetical protein